MMWLLGTYNDKVNHAGGGCIVPPSDRTNRKESLDFDLYCVVHFFQDKEVNEERNTQRNIPQNSDQNTAYVTVP